MDSAGAPQLTSTRQAILQCRLDSQRLPGKALLPVLGRPLLSLIVERLRFGSMLDDVIVATTDRSVDDPIERLCRTEGIPIFRGSAEDVLDRLYRCAQRFDLPDVIRFGADNPLVDPGVNDEIIHFYLKHRSDYNYVSNNHPPSYPDGLEVEIMPTTVLEVAWRNADQPFQREHGTPFIWDQPARFRVANVVFPGGNLHANRWTLDFPEDYEVVKAIYEALYPQNPRFSMFDILGLIERNPRLAAMNVRHVGATWYSVHLDQLRTIATSDQRR